MPKSNQSKKSKATKSPKNKAPLKKPDVDAPEAKKENQLFAAIIALGTQIKIDDGGFRKKTHAQAASLYKLARTLRDDGDLWKDFCHDTKEQFKTKKPKLAQQHESIRYVFRLAFGPNGRATQQKASKWVSSVIRFWEGGVSSKTLQLLLNKHGGFEGLRAFAKTAVIHDGKVLDPVNCSLIGKHAEKLKNDGQTADRWKLTVLVLPGDNLLMVTKAKPKNKAKSK